MKTILTPEFIAEVESIWAKTQASNREYRLHPHVFAIHSPFCASQGCPIALKINASALVRERAKRGAA